MFWVSDGECKTEFKTPYRHFEPQGVQMAYQELYDEQMTELAFYHESG